MTRYVVAQPTIELIEVPLPRCSSEEYAVARLLEAVVEARLALRFLREGLVRNAAGKAFQSWKALLAALLKLELERLKTMARSDEEGRWLEEKAVPKVPTGRMISLALMLERVGLGGLAFATNTALNLHEYQYHGPDPDLALSRYRTREEAAVNVVLLVSEVAKRVDELKTKVKPRKELDAELEELKREVRAFVRSEGQR